MRFLGMLATVVLSVGWIAPMWFAVWLFVDFWQVEAWPTMAGQSPGNSFEWFGPIKTCLNAAFAWLAVAVAYWSWVGVVAIKARSPA